MKNTKFFNQSGRGLKPDLSTLRKWKVVARADDKMTTHMHFRWIWVPVRAGYSLSTLRSQLNPLNAAWEEIQFRGGTQLKGPRKAEQKMQSTAPELEAKGSCFKNAEVLICMLRLHAACCRQAALLMIQNTYGALILHFKSLDQPGRFELTPSQIPPTYSRLFAMFCYCKASLRLKETFKLGFHITDIICPCTWQSPKRAETESPRSQFQSSLNLPVPVFLISPRKIVTPQRFVVRVKWGDAILQSLWGGRVERTGSGVRLCRFSFSSITSWDSLGTLLNLLGLSFFNCKIRQWQIHVFRGILWWTS